MGYRGNYSVPTRYGFCDVLVKRGGPGNPDRVLVGPCTWI